MTLASPEAEPFKREERVEALLYLQVIQSGIHQEHVSFCQICWQWEHSWNRESFFSARSRQQTRGEVQTSLTQKRRQARTRYPQLILGLSPCNFATSYEVLLSLCSMQSWRSGKQANTWECLQHTGTGGTVKSGEKRGQLSKQKHSDQDTQLERRSWHVLRSLKDSY